MEIGILIARLSGRWIPSPACNACLQNYLKSRVNHSAKYKVWRASRDVNVKNHDQGGVIARSCKEFKIALKVRYKHSEPKAVWILKETQGL